MWETINSVLGTIDDLVWHVNEDFDNKSGYIIINKTEGIVKNLCPVFRFFINSSTDNGKISQFIPNPVDKLNWKSTELSGMSMPSNKYIDLTLGASGTTYTAPANGWFWFSKIAGTNLFGVGIENKRNGMIIGSDAGAPGSGNAVMPVLAGDNVVVRYSATGETLGFRFIYAQGDQ